MPLFIPTLIFAISLSLLPGTEPDVVEDQETSATSTEQNGANPLCSPERAVETTLQPPWEASQQSQADKLRHANPDEIAESQKVCCRYASLTATTDERIPTVAADAARCLLRLVHLR